MAYNVLKGTVEGSVNQHGDQEIEGVKIFKNTVSGSAFWDTNAESPCATIKDIAITEINGRTKGALLVFEDDGLARTYHNLIYKNDTLEANHIQAKSLAGSADGLINIPTDKFDGKIKADDINYSHGLHNVRGAIQVKATDCIKVEEDGIGISIDDGAGLWLKSGKLTIDATKISPINVNGQNLSDNDLLIVSDISSNSTKNTTLKNLYDGYLKLKVPHAAGAKGEIQLKGASNFESSPKLIYDSVDNTLKVEGKIKTKAAEINKLTCTGAVHHNIIKTSDSVYQVAADDYTIICDSSVNKITVQLPPPCNNLGRVIVIKKANSDRYKLNSNIVEICCEESKIDINDSVVLKSNYSTRTLQSDGESWHIINKIG